MQVSDGCFRYPRQSKMVLQHIDFSLDAGDILAILGPNGAGKTTMLRCLMGLLPWTSGETLLDGKPLRRIPQRQLWQQISYVPQAKQPPTAYSVEQMILLGRASMVHPFSMPQAEDMAAVDAVIERTGLKSLRGRSCAELSGGEYQMVLIARALVSEPQILILDEPESNLDFQNQLLVLDMLSQLAAEGITCIFNTHYPAHALRRSNKSLMLSKNGEYCFGSSREMITEENILRYFGVHSVIGSMKIGNASYEDVVPISIAERPDCAGGG